jgi:hypothetical protein
MDIDISKYPMLTEDQRTEARNKARQTMIAKLGGEPRIEDFEHQQYSKYGPRVDHFVTATMIVLFVAALAVSAFHIYNMGKDTYLEGTDILWQAQLTGFALIILAESAVLLLSIMPAIWEMPQGIKIVMYTGTIGAAMVAAIGNIDVTITYTESPFNWFIAWISSFAKDPGNFILATMPPALTLIVGQGLKYRVLNTTKERFEAKRQFDVAMQDWESTLANLENHKEWVNTYAYTLWDYWKSALKIRNKREFIGSITDTERQAIVRREIKATNFFEESMELVSKRDEPEPTQAPESHKQIGRDELVMHLRSNPSDATLTAPALVKRLSELHLQASESTARRALIKFSQNGWHDTSDTADS